MATTQGGIVLKLSTVYKRSLNYGTTGQAGTMVVNLSKNGAAFGASTNTATEIANGWYTLSLSTTDTGIAGDLAYHVTAASGGPLDFCDQVQANILTDYNVDASGNVSIASSIKKNANLNGFMFLMTNSTTHAPQTGLTVTAQRSLAGAGFAPCANSVTELSNGIYTINLAATDVNSNSVMLRFTASGADDLDLLLLTQP